MNDVRYRQVPDGLLRRIAEKCGEGRVDETDGFLPEQADARRCGAHRQKKEVFQVYPPDQVTIIVCS